MLCNMERYANRLAVFVTKSYLDVHFAILHILSKNPHLTLFIKSINYGTFNIILLMQVLHYQLTLQRRNVQLQQSLSVLRTVISEANTKHLSLNIKLLQKHSYFLNPHHIT